MSLWSLRSTVNTCRWFKPPSIGKRFFLVFALYIVQFITIRNYFGYKYRFRFLKLYTYQLFPVLKRQPVTSQQVLNGLFSHLFIEQYFQDFLNQLDISFWNWLWYIHVYKPQGLCVKKNPIECLPVFTSDGREIFFFFFFLWCAGLGFRVL